MAARGELFIVQARPETAHARRDPAQLETFTLERRGTVLATGRASARRSAPARSRACDTPPSCSGFRPGDVLVTGMTDPDWEPIIKRAAAIVTDRGGRTCHAAIVEPRARRSLRGRHRQRHASCCATAQPVTVSCAEGETGLVMRRARSPFGKRGAATRRAAGDADQDPTSTSANPDAGVRSLVPAGRRRRARAR